MDLELKDKIVLITGAAGLKGSIGETILQSLVKEGAIPAVIDHNDRGYGYIEEIQANGVDGLFVKTDVTDVDQIEKAVQKVVQKYGRIDVVINNVGVNDGVGLDATAEEFIQSLKLNVVSYFLVAKYALPYLKETKGNILNVGSKVAYTGQGNTSGYAAAKGGVLSLTREWAVDLIKYGIRVNCLIIAECWTPSYDKWIKTMENGEEIMEGIKAKIPLENRMTTPQELADQVLFTISNRASHTTGQHIFADGGYTHLDRALLSS
ncbi:SDR family oxidoreductase [Reichenbachiella carrageenanivorans]|uniref:SDR family oxidoreductase n=1 Tax=Reichenbachiella carrageenanivorans TaxID=2979869 RepID=A0ABY6D110_9BACT|nr:SDR family oxidoreductase [Reichenbachiella carrageenanivorans]UXX79859.1 SDR family oxidoreductase [Reichenbachiella carrageenanivorans]